MGRTETEKMKMLNLQVGLAQDILSPQQITFLTPFITLKRIVDVNVRLYPKM
jgi:hypothetical protein